MYEIWSSGCPISIEPLLYPTFLSLIVTHDIRDLILWSRHQFSPIVGPPTKELVFIAASPTTIQWRCVLDWAINSHAQEVNPIRFCSGFSRGSEATMDWKYCLNISHLRVRYWHTAASGVWSRNQEERIIVQFSVLWRHKNTLNWRRTLVVQETGSVSVDFKDVWKTRQLSGHIKISSIPSFLFGKDFSGVSDDFKTFPWQGFCSTMEWVVLNPSAFMVPGR